MPQSYFQFKRFRVHHARSAMKVGTDGVLLGAWAGSLSRNPQKILDVGSGTGLIALMMAQRFPKASVDGLELDAAAHEEATLNAVLSPFSSQLEFFQGDFIQWFPSRQNSYDLVVSNPPFFERATRPENHSRTIARHGDEHLPLPALARGLTAVLRPEGELAVILPPLRAEEFLRMLEPLGFGPHRITYVKGQPNAAVKRWLVACSSKHLPLKEDTLVIEEEPRKFTAEYRALTKDFYLAF